MVEFARTGLDIGVTSGTRRYCPMGRLDILGNAYPFAEVAVPGGRRSSRLGPTTEFPTFRVDSSPYGTGIEPATTILKAVCFTPDPLSPFSFAAAYAATRKICSRGQATWECLLPTRLEKLL